MFTLWPALARPLFVLIALTAAGMVAVVTTPYRNAPSVGGSPIGAATSTLGVPAARTGPVSTVPPTVPWFALDPDLASTWKVLPDPTTPWKVELRRTESLPGQEKRIIALYSKAGSAFDLGLNTLVRDLDSKKIPAVYTVVNWNGAAPAAQQWLSFAERQHYDLMLSMGSEATTFLHDHDADGRVPVVTVVSKDPVLLGQMRDYDHGSGTSIAYTSVSVPIDLQMTYLLQLKPGLKNIGVLYEQSNTSAVETQVQPLRKASADRKINLIDVAVVDVKQAPQELKAKIPGAVAQMLSTDPRKENSIFLVTGSTSVFTAIDTINLVAENVPVVSMFPELVQPGESSAVLSIGVSFTTSAHLSARYAADILIGRVKASDLRVGVVTPPDIAVNFLKADEIGLKIPFAFFESASQVYDTTGKLVRDAGQTVQP